MSDSYQNIASNVILPFDPRRTKLLLGSLEYVAFEVVVAKLIRKIIKMDNFGWTQLAYIHALSLPFMGGAAGLFADNQGYNAPFTTSLMDGAKGIPAVLIAQYLVQSFTKGFHAPWFNMKELLITAGTKALTRPVVGFVFEYLPDAAAENLRVLDLLFALQQQKSTLAPKKKD